MSTRPVPFSARDGGTVRAHAPPATEAASGSDERVVVDYARGGGSSGARLNDVGVSSEDDGSAARANARGTAVSGTTATAAGAHGAIAWQPFGAHGNWQGDRCGPGCPGADGACSPAGIVIPAIASADEADVARHA